jgi:hypothetical protein
VVVVGSGATAGGPVSRGRDPISGWTWTQVQARYGGKCTCRPSRVIGAGLCGWAYYLGLAGNWLYGTIAVLVGVGFPTCFPVMCWGPLQRGHQWPHSKRGTERINNLEPQCRRHNLQAIGARWVWWGIVRRWPPGVVAYGFRRLWANLR